MLDLPLLPKLLLLFSGALALASCRQATDPPAPSTPPAPLRLECRLTGDAPAALRFELSNPGERPVYALKWNTPLENPAFGTILTVTRDGTEIPYGGPMAKRGEPVREDYVEIPAGGTVAATVDLTQAYDLSAPRTYEVRVTEGLVDATREAAELPRPRDRHQALPLRCGDLRLVVR
jgi:hypothetical protein